MAETSLNYLNTGIPELNDLLTKNVAWGIALPEAERAASSTLAIRGATGSGKSVLASIIAFNLHYGLTQTPQGNWVLPFAFYFSFAQPAEGLRRYIATILQPPSQDVRYPLIASPTSFRGKPEEGGIEMLRRSLLNTLVAFDSNELDQAMSWEEAHARLRKCYEGLGKSRDWQLAPNQEAAVVRETPPAPAAGRSAFVLAKDQVHLCPVVIVDPINFFFDYRDSRFAVAELFETFRTLRWPLLLTLEDAEDGASEAHRQLMSDVEFEADVVLRLLTQRERYVRHTVEVTKCRNSQPHYGPQMFRIERPYHSLWNIPSVWADPPPFLPPSPDCWLKPEPKDPQGKRQKALPNLRGLHPGFLIFKSIHWQLSISRDRDDKLKSVHHSGIGELDHILAGGASGQSGVTSNEPSLLPADAFVLVHGQKGGHKLSVAFNLLAAGLWDPRRRDDGTTDSHSVMLLSMGEDSRIQIENIALAVANEDQDTGISNNNGSRILGFEQYGDGNVGDKIMLHEYRWRCRKTDTRAGDPPAEFGETRLIEVTFEPGFLSVEEFLWAIRSLTGHFRPSRILLDNTAQLRMRFPELEMETMLFPALSSLAGCQKIMLIVIDVEGDGADPKLSYGLKASADYLVHLVDAGQRLPKPEPKDEIPAPARPPSLIENLNRHFKERFQAPAKKSILSVTNVRGKNYNADEYPIHVVSGATNATNRLVVGVPLTYFQLPGVL